MTNARTTIIETERLILRRLTMADVDALFVLYRDPKVRTYFPEGTLTYAETKDELEWIINVYYGQYGWGLWATMYKPTGAFIGRCGLLPWTIDGCDEVEVAYLLDRAYWGQGLATEAAQAIVHYAFGHLQLTRLICLIDSQNRPSQRVAEKIGMTFEKAIVDDKGPALLYAMAKPGTRARAVQPG